MGEKSAAPNSGLPQNQITTLAPVGLHAAGTPSFRGALKSLKPLQLQQREQSAIEASCVLFYRRCLKEGTLFVLHGRTCAGVLCTAAPVTCKLRPPDQRSMAPHQNQRVSCHPILSVSILVQLDRDSRVLNKRRPCARNPSTPLCPAPRPPPQNTDILSLILASSCHSLPRQPTEHRQLHRAHSMCRLVYSGFDNTGSCTPKHAVCAMSAALWPASV